MLLHPPSVREISGMKPGPTLLVTGGVDGDEYAGMEAARRIAERYASGDFSGRLIVIPIVNGDGFRGESSHNPTDHKFPKYLFPGSAFGSASERLVHWLVSRHVNRADAWMDLHGGAITEGLNPFLWCYETGISDIDERARGFLSASGAELALMERVSHGTKAERLARQGCVYVIAESGERGTVLEADVARHVRWIEAMMRTFGMLPGENPVAEPPRLLRSFTLVTAPMNGIWKPRMNPASATEVGEALGTFTRLDGTGAETLPSPVTGTPLWWKETPAMRNGDILVAIGHETL
jgi:predicted deacylase